MTMRMSADGRAKLIKREGFKTRAYRDSVGVWTIGVGHTSAAGAPVVTPGLVVSKADVDAILSRDLGQYERAVNEAVRTPLSQGQFDALTSLCFNIGVGAFEKSSVVKRLNAYDYAGAADAFLLWNKPKEIIGRRRGERAQFLAATGDNHLDRGALRLVEAPSRVEGENVSAAYLRAAGSRTIAGADQAQQGVAGSVISIGGATMALSQVKDVADQAQEAATAIQSGVSALEALRTYWPLLAVLGLSAVAAYFVWRAWRGAAIVKAARVDDAACGLNVGR
ncbi:lysozyme [Methylosinus sp. Ce-a6]|uniref:lysozyme n=1 Tax=Methylosinus sp. Ce-a6 TaxID=2172005 RepID=UPI0013584252|nr:lysozyme [Methylosinus sp. Ce-a6]